MSQTTPTSPNKPVVNPKVESAIHHARKDAQRSKMRCGKKVGNKNQAEIHSSASHESIRSFSQAPENQGRKKEVSNVSVRFQQLSNLLVETCGILPYLFVCWARFVWIPEAISDALDDLT
jgi:hypothetical protein